MVAGHLTKKHDRWYIVLNIRSREGVKKPKWFSTGLKVQGNKRKAEVKLMQLRQEYGEKELARSRNKGVYFDEYLYSWLNQMQSQLSPSTYAGYQSAVNNIIIPYFKTVNVPLSDLTTNQLQAYYDSMLARGVSPNTVLRHHANIHKALKDAFRRGLIVRNPAESVVRPRKAPAISTSYSEEEVKKLFLAIQGHPFELAFILGALYGLRRSEILGLKWNAIEYDNNTLHICHSLQRVKADGKYTTIGRDVLKRYSSNRTLPLVENLRNLFREHQRRLYGDHKPDPEQYVFLDEKGDVIKPNRLSRSFIALLEMNNLRRIRFHDLRHTCASMLVSKQVPLIEVQQWLGHSSINTTADMYAHLDYSMKLRSADIISQTLSSL